MVARATGRPASASRYLIPIAALRTSVSLYIERWSAPLLLFTLGSFPSASKERFSRLDALFVPPASVLPATLINRTVFIYITYIVFISINRTLRLLTCLQKVTCPSGGRSLSRLK